MKVLKFLVLCIIIILVLSGISADVGFAQSLFGPWGFPWISNPFYSPFIPFGGGYFPSANIFPPLYGVNLGFGLPFGPITAPSPAILSPYQRRPNATIIFTSPTLTAVSAAPGVILIGATGVIAPTVAVPTGIAPAVVTPTAAIAASIPTATIAPAPAPLLSILAVLYASALLDGKALLSTANPLLFAYLSTLVL
ncbi:MAG: hypothetical protein ACMUIU_14285 [bacterium]